MSGKYTVRDVSQYVNSEGLGYAVRYGLSADSIENPQLARLWVTARTALAGIERILAEEFPDHE